MRCGTVPVPPSRPPRHPVALHARYGVLAVGGTQFNVAAV